MAGNTIIKNPSGIELTAIVQDDDLYYDEKYKRYGVNNNFINTTLNVNMNNRYRGEKFAEAILDRCSRQIYAAVYANNTYPEDRDRKEYLLTTDVKLVNLLKLIIRSHVETTIFTRRDILIMEHGVDLDGQKLIDDFDENMEKYEFSLPTRQIMKQNGFFAYRERIDQDIPNEVLGVGY